MSVEASHALSGAEAEAALRLGFESVPEIVEACLPALERRRSIALMAGEGAGIELLYGLAAERAIEAGEGVRALILTASRSAAAGCAAAVNAFETDGAPRALVWPPPSSPGAEPPAGIAVLAGRAGDILPEVRAGRVRLADLSLLVIDGIEAIELTDDWEAVEALLGTLEPDTQKIVSCLGPGERLANLLTHRITRAYRWPSELFDEATAEHAGPSGLVSYAAAPGLEERLDLLATALRAAGEDATVICGDRAAADEVARGLGARGLSAGEADAPRVHVREAGGERPDTPVAAVFGLPLGLAALEEILGAATRRIAVVPTRHLGQLLLLVRRAGWPAGALAAGAGWPDLDPIERFRALVAEEVRRVDPAAELLLLEPLLEEHGTVPVAAALASLLRRRPAGPSTVKQWPDMEADSGLSVGPLPAADGGGRGTRPAWTRIYVGVGRRDGARAGDLVGAITGETGIAGGQIGKVEIRGNFTLIDIDSQVVDDVIRKLDGSVIKGRSVSVRLDREA